MLVSLALRPGALLADESGGALLRFYRDPGRIVGLVRCMEGYFFWLTSRLQVYQSRALASSSGGGAFEGDTGTLAARQTRKAARSSRRTPTWLQQRLTGRARPQDAAPQVERQGHFLSVDAARPGLDRGAAHLSPPAFERARSRLFGCLLAPIAAPPDATPSAPLKNARLPQLLRRARRQVF